MAIKMEKEKRREIIIQTPLNALDAKVRIHTLDIAPLLSESQQQ